MEERFWAKVDKSGECWLWTAAKVGNGYGCFEVDGKTQRAHRFAWELTNGPIPKGLCACHRCDVRACCNPAHLFLGTQAANMADMNAKGRSPRGETNGNSKLTTEQVGEIREASGSLRVIAARFGISRQQVHGIRTGRSWAHLLAEVAP